MQRVELTVNQWGLVLRALRKDIWGGAHPESEERDLRIAEDRIIDMAFETAKRLEAAAASKKSAEENAWEIIGQRHAEDMLAKGS
jgi:hypothetical protein